MKTYSSAFLISISILLLSLRYAANPIVLGLQLSNLPANPQKADSVKDSDLLTLSCNNVTEISKVECEALVLLYTDTAGANWTNHTNWLATTTPCSWFGVVCSNKHVTELNLGENNLDGYLPAELGNLTSLINLSLNDNQLYFNIPTTIGNLSSLKILDLYNNQLSGVIGDEIANLTNLEEFALGYNQFGGEIPSALGNLPKLTALYLNDNHFRGDLPGNLVNLTKLDVFWFQHTDLCEPSDTTFQSWLGRIRHLNRTNVICKPIPTPIPTPKPDLTVDHIEVVQVFLVDKEPRYGLPLPLIANKSTLVRVYVRINGALSIDNVSARLYLKDAQGRDHIIDRSYNKPITAKTSPDPNRLNDTINFLPQTNWLTGTVIFWAEVDPANKIAESDESNNVSGKATKTFQLAKPLRIGFIPVNYNRTAVPSDRIYDTFTWAQRIYPTALIEPPIRFSAIPFNPPFDGEVLFTRLESVKKVWEQQNNRKLDFVFGWITEGVANPEERGNASIVLAGDTYKNRGGQVAYGVDLSDSEQRKLVFAHEIGHLLGRPHMHIGRLPNTCKNASSIDASDWPYSDVNIQVWGIDITSQLNLKHPNDTVDYMSYCGNQPWLPYFGGGQPVWTSPWTYLQIYNEKLRQQPADILVRSSSTLQRYLTASGWVYSNTATLDPMWIITTTLAPENPLVGTDYCFEEEDSSGNSLSRECFDLSFVDFQTGQLTNKASFYLTLPYFSNMSRIILKKGSQQLAIQSISDHVPFVSVISPNGGEIWNAHDSYTINWAGSDMDGDNLSYRVLYSQNGNSWMPLVSSTSATSMTVRSSELAGGANAWIRVLATDGINTSIDQSDASFIVGRKPPFPYIVAPESNSTLSPDTIVILEGYAYDLEDGAMTDTALSWKSDKDGDLGLGSYIQTTLSPGEHTISMGAVDSDGRGLISSVKIFVGHKNYLPVILKEN